MAADTKSLTFRTGRLEDKRMYRDVLQLYFAGYPAPWIASTLKMTPQSVNRTLRKLRSALVRQQRIGEFLDDEARRLRFREYPVYVWLIKTSANSIAQRGENYHQELRTCFTQCPRAHSPGDFIEKFIDTRIDPTTFPYPVDPQVKETVAFAEVDEAIDRKGSCRSCPFGLGARNLSMAFADCRELYADIQFYFSVTRIRSASDFYFHFMAAALISMVRRLALLRHPQAVARGCDDILAARLTTRKQIKIVDHIYRLIQRPAPDSIDEYGNFIHSQGYAPPSSP
tara:strand:+ start:15451 stop:16302 length:852 start_codon:yes stop_codon:yes gene_type:complete